MTNTMQREDLRTNIYMLLFCIFIIVAGWKCNEKPSAFHSDTTFDQKMDSIEKAYNDSLYPSFAEPVK